MKIYNESLSRGKYIYIYIGEKKKRPTLSLGTLMSRLGETIVD